MILIGRGLNQGAKRRKRGEGLVSRSTLHCAVVKARVRAERGRRRRSRKRESEAEREEISGDNSERDPPVPIPNTEVKPLSADGTWLETARESRTLPDSTGSWRGRTASPTPLYDREADGKKSERPEDGKAIPAGIPRR